MFISTFDLFKIGVGPSSSHTVGPMLCARLFVSKIDDELSKRKSFKGKFKLKCYLKGSLALTGRGHGSNWAIALGLHGYKPEFPLELNPEEDIESLKSDVLSFDSFLTPGGAIIQFCSHRDLVYHTEEFLPEHPNALVFKLLDSSGFVLLSETFFSIGGGFVCTRDEFLDSNVEHETSYDANSKPIAPFPFDSAKSMLQMTEHFECEIADLKLKNELVLRKQEEINLQLNQITKAMFSCVESGLKRQGILPGGLEVKRRASEIYIALSGQKDVGVNDWLCAYAMAVNEQNADGQLVVTAPTNGAAGVIPAVLYYLVKHENISELLVSKFILTAAAIGD